MTGLAIRMILGGAVCGSFLGMFSGGVLGGLYGWLYANVSYGLDGALAGGCIGMLCGSVYGAWLTRLETLYENSRDSRSQTPQETVARESPASRSASWISDSRSNAAVTAREPIPHARGQPRTG